MCMAVHMYKILQLFLENQRVYNFYCGRFRENTSFFHRFANLEALASVFFFNIIYCGTCVGL